MNHSHPPPPSGDSTAKPPFRRTAVAAWLALLRPATTLVLTLTAAALCLVATHGDADWHTAFRYAVAIGLLSAAAAVLNDLTDRAHDGSTRIWRPLPSGRVALRSAAILAMVLLVGALALSGSLGWRPLAITAAMAAAAMVYSGVQSGTATRASLRGSFFGWAPFALIGVLLPVGAADAADARIEQLWWAVPVGAASGMAAFLLYKLPDYERDDFDGVRSILHWMGIDAALPLSWAGLAGALTLAAASVNVVDGNLAWLIGPLIYLLLAGLGCIGLLWMQVSERRLMWQRWLLVPGLALLLIGWLGAMAAA